MTLILETSRLILKPLLKSDFDLLHKILVDPYVRKYLCDDTIFSVGQIQAMLQKSQELFEREKFGLWSIANKTKLEIIGFVGLWYFFEEAQPQLIYALLPKATKKGYATEAAARILDYSFVKLGYNYLVVSCDRPNLESQQVATRLGMKQLEARMIDGKPTLFFRIDKITFAKNNCT
ncbi:GNAT family N-acetyltransferase [Myxosarcina sp. GI1]|uniref:GNAT family N-acetyltransferase n=1 Tax=Myxosarcina sp. GI1 TaxID=1541065 RepID=UPI0005675C44|nr:GNAT family N-acetyltransferase [Myxosarcina sp. GI1]